jgi:proteasome regulatory subunit
MTTKDKDIIDSVLYSYTSASSIIEEENRVLKETVNKMKEELDRLKKPPLMVCEVLDLVADNAVIRIPNGNQFYVSYDRSLSINIGDGVLCDQKNLNIVKKIDTSRKFNVEKFVIVEKPNVSWEVIGGLELQEQEIKEVIELPLKKPKLFREIGITPPKGILLYGPPGTGKTLLAKAVASSTNSTFIEVVGSELVQKFIGEGAKLVKEIFELARNKAPAIVFIDELDALAARRIEIGTSGEREVQRTFMQLLSEIDGFKALEGVKIIGCTNRIDILDPAILRPGRLDRLIHVTAPDKEGLKQIFKIHTKRMNLDSSINLNTILSHLNEFSGAEVQAACTEAGYFAIRDGRTHILENDFVEAAKKVRQSDDAYGEFLTMFG